MRSVGKPRRACHLPLGRRQVIPSLAPLLKKVTPGVVSIAVKGRIGEEQNPLLKDPEIRRSLNMPKGSKSVEFSGAGSGVVFDAKSGLIVTNNHILEYADEITVVLSDGRKLTGKRIGGDAETDIALIRVTAEGLTPIPLGNSDKLEVGDFVLAIGNPFQLGQTVTSGIVGGLRRSGLGIEQYEEFIQTDASINPGNSGGALVNLRGELVGINTAVVGDNGGRTGIGFAIPVNMARAVVDQILVHGDIQRGQLGITIETLSRTWPARNIFLPSKAAQLSPRSKPVRPANVPGRRAILSLSLVAAPCGTRPTFVTGSVL